MEILLCLLLLLGKGWAQESPSAHDNVLHVSTSLVLVDVTAERTQGSLHTRELLSSLAETDFRLFDNNHEVPVRTFDSGVKRTVHPVALWLVVQCDMGYPRAWNSSFVRGRTTLLRPGLNSLVPQDSLGVAHWCDDGAANIDLESSHDPDAALAIVDKVLEHAVAPDTNRKGELAMQRMIELILAHTKQEEPSRLPVLLFIHGDHNATYVDEATRILEDLLETSGFVFGLNDEYEAQSGEPKISGGQIYHLIHFYSQKTGGEYYSVSHPELFSAALSYIITQMHLRYVLGFKPPSIDGKRHDLRVELTPEAKKRVDGTSLRFRPEYIPTPQSVSSP